MRLQSMQTRCTRDLGSPSPISPVRASISAGGSISIESFLLSVLSGVLLFLSFPYPDLGLLAWIALVPLIRLAERERPLPAFFYGLAGGFVFFGALIYWMLVAGAEVARFVSTLTDFGSPIFWKIVLSLLAWLPLVIYLSLYLAGFAGVSSFLLRKAGLYHNLFLLPALWTVLELVRSLGFAGFPWGFLGYSQHALISLLQIARWTGVYGISFLVVLVNFCVWSGLVLGRTKRRRDLGIMPLGLAVLLSVWGYGSLTADNYSHQSISSQAYRSMDIAIVQPNVPQEMKLDRKMRSRIFDVYEDLTLRAATKAPDLIIYPESIFIDPILEDYQSYQWLKRMILLSQTYLLTGAITSDEEGNEYNSILLFAPNQRILGQYNKIHLVPFGEYVPFRSHLGWLRGLSLLPFDLSKGEDYTIFGMSGDKFGSGICFESAFPDLMREFRSRGAELFFILTNDGWFKKSSAADQHFLMAAFRAVENGVYVVQVANTGISGIFAPNGELLAKSNLEEKIILYSTVYFIPGATFYSTYGNVFVYVLVVGVLVTSFLVLWPRKEVSAPRAKNYSHRGD